MQPGLEGGIELKGIVAYDTYYGNTKLVAEAVLEQIKADGHEGELRNVRERYPAPPQGDFLFVGSPVRMGSVTRNTKRFVKNLDEAVWKDKPTAVYTTTGLMPRKFSDEKAKKTAEKWILGAGIKLRDLAKARGLNTADKLLYVEVKDSKGPLVDTGIEKTKQYTREFLQTLKK